MSERKIIDIAEFLLPHSEGLLIVWRHEDELPPSASPALRAMVLDSPLSSFQFVHGWGLNSCAGTFSWKKVSPSLAVLLCNQCQLRLPIPRTVDTLMRLVTWGDSHGWNRRLIFTLEEWNQYHAMRARREGQLQMP